MEAFRYVARNPQGIRVEGSVAAEGTIAVADHLRARGLVAVRISRDQEGVLSWLRDGSWVSRETSLMVFFRSLAILLEAGITLRNALEIVGEEITDPHLQEIVSSMRGAVDGGRSLALAMEMHARVFTPLAIALIKAAEQSGTLSETLERYAALLERQRSLKRRIIGAMMYPAIVLLAAGGLFIGMMLVILPTLASLFTQMNVEMPLQMKVSLAVGTWLSAGGWIWSLAILFGGGSLLTILIRRHWLDEFDAVRLHVPLFGRIIRRAIIARWARLLASLLGAGIGIVEALEASIPALGSRVYAKEIERIARHLEDGGAVSGGLRSSRWFDPLVVQLVSIGEETGRLDVNLIRLSELYERDLVDELAALVALIEPLVILIVGTVVGGVVLSIFVPLYSLIGNVR